MMNYDDDDDDDDDHDDDAVQLYDRKKTAHNITETNTTTYAHHSKARV